jgi:hypothetical protein
MIEVRIEDLHKILYVLVLLEMFNMWDVFLSLIFIIYNLCEQVLFTTY